MRILHLIESLEFGGAEKVAIDLANEMANHHEVTICCVKMIGDLGPSVDQRIRVLCLDKGEGNDPSIPVRLARLLREQRVDVLHAHNWGVYLEAALAGLLARTPVRIHTVHGPYMDYAPGTWPRMKRRLRHAFERLTSSSFNKIVTVSDSIQEYIRDEIGISGSHMQTIHNGIRIEGPARVTRNDDEVRCVTVGRLAEIKNQAMMVRAFHRVGFGNARLWLVGDGPERVRLEALVDELGLAERVVFVGFRHDVADLLATSDIFLMSSNYEGVSIAVLEAMRAGLPVLGTSVGGMGETVRPGTGILVPAGDEEAMATAMEKLISSPLERKRLGAAGKAFLAAEFSIQHMVEQYEMLYRANQGNTA